MKLEDLDMESIPELDRMSLDGILDPEIYEKYRKKAAEGDPFYLSELGNVEMVNGFYFHDEERRARGLRCFAEAAEKGEASSATWLGYLYRKGKYGVEKDLKQAAAWFKRAAELGDLTGRLEYAAALQRDDAGIHRDDPDEEKNGYIREGEKLTEEVYAALKKAAAEGRPRALYELGMLEAMVGHKLGQKERVARGVKYLEAAAAKGSGAAATYLGTLYHEGKFDYPVDMDRAIAWYRKGAELGDPLGMSNYAVSLQRGEGGLERNDQEAFLWLRTAADAGLDVAQYNTALALHVGRGVAADRGLARKYFQMAAKNGIKMAEVWLYSQDYRED